MIPSPRIPLVDTEGQATRALLGVLPVDANVRLVDQQGQATTYLRIFLAAMSHPVPAAPLTNPDGTPTRVFTRLLGGLS